MLEDPITKDNTTSVLAYNYFITDTNKTRRLLAFQQPVSDLTSGRCGVMVSGGEAEWGRGVSRGESEADGERGVRRGESEADGGRGVRRGESEGGRKGVSRGESEGGA